MTLGDKIKKNRILRNLTQKELGIKSGFSSTTADVRIRQYESNKMAPRAKKRQEIANALEIDISSLSNINITNIDDIMHILFEFEEQLGMDIEQKDGKIHLVFDDSNKEIEQLINYLLIWYHQKKNISTHNPDNKLSSDIKNKYEIWKSRFPIDLYKQGW